MFPLPISSRARTRLICAAMLLAYLPILDARAADAAPLDRTTAPITLVQVLQRAEAHHPLFASWRARERAAQARHLQAGLKPSPELGLTVENAFGTGALSGYTGAETTLSFSQLIERGGLLDRRVDRAAAERDLLIGAGEIARLDLRAEVARRFVHVLSDQAQLGITHQATVLAQETLDEVTRRVEAARAPLAERSRSRVSLERARLEEEHAEHELLSSRRHLAAAIGSMQADFGPAEGDLMTLPPVADFEVLLARLQAAPDVLRFASAARLRESELRLAQARRTAGLRLGAGLRRLENSDDLGLVFSASLPLFASSRERGNLAEAEAHIEQIGPDREQAMLLAQAQLYELYQELNHARLEVNTQRERVLPAVEEALEQTRFAYERGRYSLLELRNAQIEWATQHRLLIQAAAGFHGNLIEIQRLTGAPVPSPGVARAESSQP